MNDHAVSVAYPCNAPYSQLQIRHRLLYTTHKLSNMKKLKIGMIAFPQMTILDFAGPYEVFFRAPCFEVHIIGADTKPFKVEGGMCMQADLSYDDCAPMDIIFVPGGKGINPLMQDEKFMRFLKLQAGHAQYIASVCTGAVLLAAAGLLNGYKATTHWRSLELLHFFGAEAIDERVVIDRNRITGGGITAGIDFGLVLTALIGGEQMAKTIQLLLEYDPKPPFKSGSPKLAEPHILQTAKEITQSLFDDRVKIIQTILGN